MYQKPKINKKKFKIFTNKLMFKFHWKELWSLRKSWKMVDVSEILFRNFRYMAYVGGIFLKILKNAVLLPTSINLSGMSWMLIFHWLKSSGCLGNGCQKRFGWTCGTILKFTTILTVYSPNRLFWAYFEVGLQPSCN